MAKPEEEILELMEKRQFRLVTTPPDLVSIFESTYKRPLGATGRAYVFGIENRLWKLKKTNLEGEIERIRGDHPNFNISLLHMAPSGAQTTSVFMARRGKSELAVKNRVVEQGLYRVAVVISQTRKRQPVK